MLGELFSEGDTISFDVYPASIIGASFSNVLVISSLDGETMRAIGRDPIALHASVYPMLPPGSPNNAFEYNYLKLQLPNRSITYVGIPWIIRNTVVKSNSVDILVRIRRRKATDAAVVALALSSNGIVLDPDSVTVVPGTQAPTT